MDLTDKIQFLRNEDGKKSFVVIPLGIFEELFEDYIDTKAILERQDEASSSFDEFIKELKADGKL